MNFLKKINCWMLVALGLVAFQQNATAQCVQAACVVDFNVQLSQCGEATTWSHGVDGGDGIVSATNGVSGATDGAVVTGGVLGEYDSESQCLTPGAATTTPLLANLRIRVLDPATGSIVPNTSWPGATTLFPHAFFPWDFSHLQGNASYTYTVELYAFDADGGVTMCTTNVTIFAPTCPNAALLTDGNTDGSLTGTLDLGSIECTDEPTQFLTAPTSTGLEYTCAYSYNIEVIGMDMIPNTDASTGAHCFTLTQTWALKADCKWTTADEDITVDEFTQMITIEDTVLPEIVSNGQPNTNDVIPEGFFAFDNHTDDCYIGTPDECMTSAEGASAGLQVHTFDECDFDVALKMTREASFGEVIGAYEHTYNNDPRQDNHYCYTRMFIYRGEDNCGNLSEDSLVWVQTVEDTQAPTFGVVAPGDQEINSCDLDEEIQVNITVNNIADNCTVVGGVDNGTKYLALFATVYDAAGNIVSITSAGNSDYAQGMKTFTVSVPGSDACESYTVKISMKDPCLNSSEQEVTFEVCNPNEGPIAKCDEVFVTLAEATDTADPDDYRAEVDAVDLDEGSEDLCTEYDQFPYIQPNPATIIDNTFWDFIPGYCTSLFYDFSDFDGCVVTAGDLGVPCLSSLGINAADDVYINYNYVIVQVRRPGGTWGNSIQFTEADCPGPVTVELRSINALCEMTVCESVVTVQGCPDAGNFAAGRILNEDGAPVKNVVVNGDTGLSTTTNAAGEYNVAGTIATPVFNDNHRNGVSSYDLYLMRRHILAIQALDSPYKMLAADANKSGTITGADLSNIQNLIVNNTTTFSSNTSWNFVDAGFAITNTNFGSAPTSGAGDFVAVKTGDVNLSAGTVLRAAGTLEFAIEDRVVAQGEEFTVAFGASEFNNIAALQMTMAYEGLEVVAFEAGLEEVANRTIAGKTSMVWAGSKGTSIANGESVLNVTFRASEAGKLSNLLNVSSDITAAEAYDATGTMFNIAFRFTSTSEDFALFQNAPNPFNNVTVIGFNLPSASDATITIYDVAGRVLKTVTGNYAKGYNQVDLSSNDLPSAGVLHYQLTAGEHTAVKQMVIVE